MNPTVLAIDGGGVRGVIPLEFMILLQEHLGSQCALQDLIDLAIGTSSGESSSLPRKVAVRLLNEKGALLFLLSSFSVGM